MVEKLLKLRQQFHVKTLQIEALVAKKHGMGNLDDLAPADYQRVQTITGNLLEMWEEGEHEEGFVHDDTQARPRTPRHRRANPQHSGRRNR